MPDITMCSGEGCPMRELCWRFTAPPTPNRQSFFAEPPLKENDVDCDHYWPTEDRRARDKS